MYVQLRYAVCENDVKRVDKVSVYTFQAHLTKIFELDWISINDFEIK